MKKWGRPARWAVLAAMLAFAAAAWLAAAQSSAPERDAWQQPERVMDALGLHPGSWVADVGAGEGYFTFHLAARVGASGKVIAEDVRDRPLKTIRAAVEKDHLTQVEVIQGVSDDPKLPAGALDAILVCNAYHEFIDYDAMMAAMLRALKPGGLLGIIDPEDELGEKRSVYQERHTLPQEITREDAARAGFRFLREERGFERPHDERKYYFLIFQKPR